jgi:type II secretory pathway predicted ATPase ExeA
VSGESPTVTPLPVSEGHHFMLVGPSGSGKTTLLRAHLQAGMSLSHHAVIAVSLPAVSGAKQVLKSTNLLGKLTSFISGCQLQHRVEQQLEQRQHCRFGPNKDTAVSVLFIDDMSISGMEYAAPNPPRHACLEVGAAHRNKLYVRLKL